MGDEAAAAETTTERVTEAVCEAEATTTVDGHPHTTPQRSPLLFPGPGTRLLAQTAAEDAEP